jgi:prolyl oligopeptidase
MAHRKRALLFALALILPAMAAAAPPVARVAPVVDDYYGTKVADPYRWMESGKDSEWMPWLKGQAEHSRAVFDSMPGRASLLAEVGERSGALPAVRRAEQAGPWLFYQSRPAGAEDSRLLVRDGKGAERVLIDPAAGGGENAQVLDWWHPSPDGRFVALGLSKRGSERSVLHVIETATGRILDDRIDNTDFGVVTWLPDGSGLSYLRMVGEHGTPGYYLKSEARLHILGASGEDPLLITRSTPGVPIADAQFNFVRIGPNSRTAILGVRDGRSEAAFYRADLSDLRAGRARWTRIADFADTVVSATWSDDNLYLLSRKAASNGRVLRLSASRPDLAAAQAVAIPGNPVIEELYASKSGVYVQTLEGGVSGLWFAPIGGAPRRIALPKTGTLYWLVADPARDGALMSMAGWTDAQQVYHLAENGDVHDISLIPPPPFDTSRYEARRLEAAAKDGTKIPYTIVARKGLVANGRNPLLLEAYGSYGASMTPFFDSKQFPFLDRGGVYVMANVRGGGEFGRDWHYAGKAETKATTWRDAIAVAEKLIADRITSSQAMTIIGTSAGGVMVGGAVNERPDLFTGAVANVGFMNPVRYVSEQNMADIEEWGGPIADARSFKTMFDLDPYNHIRDRTKYPATLVVSGINDPRAATFHSAKYAARMAAATTSGEPVLLRIDFDAGHGIGSSRSQTDAVWADIFSFVLWQAGVPEFQPRTP